MLSTNLLLIAILFVLLAVVGVIKNGMNQIIKGLESIDERLAAPKESSGA